MKTSGSTHRRLFSVICMFLLLACDLADAVAAVHGTRPSVEALGEGKWPGAPRGGPAYYVNVTGNRAYVTLGSGGLAVFDVSDPNCVRVGGFDTPGYSYSVVVSGNYAYVADWTAGLHVIDVSNPSNCVRVGGRETSGHAQGVAVAEGRVYVADGEHGLLVLPTLENVQFTVRVDATPGEPFTIESAARLSSLVPWTPIFTTNVSTMPFDYMDFDVRTADKPHKFYRVRQP
jgi:LVIVD repeat